MPEKEEKEETFDEVFNKVAGETDGDVNKDEDTKTVDTDDVTKPKEDSERGKGVEEKVKLTYEELEHKHKTLQGMFEKTSQELEKLKESKEVEEKPKKEEEKPKAEPKPEEEDTELTEYLKEYSYISRNEAKLRKKELEVLKKDIVKEISKTYDIPIKAAEKLVQDKINEDAENHLVSIMEAHEDYGTEKEKVVGTKVFTKKDVQEWIDTLSPIRKREYNAIIEEGNTEEVIDLLTEYKKAKDIPVKTNEGVDEDKDKKDKELRLEEMETVKGKKGSVSTSLKKVEDYENAFDEAVKKADEAKKKK